MIGNPILAVEHEDKLVAYFQIVEHLSRTAISVISSSLQLTA